MHWQRVPAYRLRFSGCSRAPQRHSFRDRRAASDEVATARILRDHFIPSFLCHWLLNQRHRHLLLSRRLHQRLITSTHSARRVRVKNRAVALFRSARRKRTIQLAERSEALKRDPMQTLPTQPFDLVCACGQIHPLRVGNRTWRMTPDDQLALDRRRDRQRRQLSHPHTKRRERSVQICRWQRLIETQTFSCQFLELPSVDSNQIFARRSLRRIGVLAS